MNIFLDSSVAIAAGLSATGASRQVFDLAARNDWSLIISPWVLPEVREDLRNKTEAAREWKSLRNSVVIETDEFILDWPLVLDICDSRISGARTYQGCKTSANWPTCSFRLGGRSNSPLLRLKNSCVLYVIHVYEEFPAFAHEFSNAS